MSCSPFHAPSTPPPRHLAAAALFCCLLLPALAGATPCVVSGSGGTVSLPPTGCGYVSPSDVHMIINGLPPGTTINIGIEHEKFFNVTHAPGGSLRSEEHTSELQSPDH